VKLNIFAIFQKHGSFNVSGSDCAGPKQRGSLRLNISIIDSCCPSVSSTPTEVSLSDSTSLLSHAETETNSLKDNTDSQEISPAVYAIISIVIVLVFIILICFGYKLHQRRRLKFKFYETNIHPTLPITVFIVFLDEHPFHKEVVLRFANYLKRSFNFKIILELYNRETIYKNPTSWLEDSLTSSDIVLVIWSPGAKERWNNPEKFKERLDLFTPVLNRVKKDNTYTRNISKYIYAYFDYYDWKDLPKLIPNSNSIPCIKLMTEFQSFCLKLIQFSNNYKGLSQKSKLLFEQKFTESIPDEALALEESTVFMR